MYCKNQGSEDDKSTEFHAKISLEGVLGSNLVLSSLIRIQQGFKIGKLELCEARRQSFG